MEILGQLREISLFLGSSNLPADITLVVQVLFYLVLCAGVVAQLLGRDKGHSRLQIPVVVLNLLFIVFMMLTIFRSVTGEFPGGGNTVPRLAIVIHATLGTLAELLAIYCLLAGLKFFPRKIGVLRYWMWATYIAWTAAVIFGISVYILFYIIIPATPNDNVVTQPDANRVEDVVETPPTDTAELVPEHTEEPIEATAEPVETVAEPVEVIAEPTPEPPSQ